MKRAVWLALGAVAGALGASMSDSPAALAMAAAMTLVAALAALLGARPRTRRKAALLAASLGTAIVLARAAAGAALSLPAHTGAGAPIGGAEREAVVVSVGTPAGGLQRATIELRPPDEPERIYAWLPRYPAVAAADVIRFSAQLEPAPTEGGFAEFLARSAIGHTARIRSFERLGNDGSPLAALEGLRRTLAELMTRTVPEPQAGLGAAMAIGLRDLVARDVSNDFRVSGLSHVVAISGWHIALLGAVVSGVLAGIGRRPRSMIVLAAICGYAVLAGASPSVVRAAVMASVVLLARESGRRGQATAALALTCVGMLLLDPATVADLGFQLSVAATAGLLIWSRRLHAWLEPRLPRATPKWLLEALAVSLAAQAATLPLVLFHFGRLSLVAPLANLLVAPLVAPVMLLTAGALAAGALIGLGLPAIALAPVGLLATLGIGAMIDIARLCAALPFATLELAEPLNIVAAVLAAMFLLRAAVAPRPRHSGARDLVPAPHEEARPRLGRRRLAGGGALAMSGVLLFVIGGAQPDGRLHVTVLDIGQGDAILLEGSRGGRLLIDTGPDPDRLLTLLDARVPPWDRRLDAVVLTHPHEDHVAGLALLLDRYRIGEILEPGMVGLGPGDAAYRRKLADTDRQTRVVAAGDRIFLDGARLDVEWPLPGRVPLRPSDSGTQVNNVSIVIELHFGTRRMLFTGDVEQQIDPQLLAAGLADDDTAPLDVLKVAHHGSGTATTDALVARLAPRIAIVSAGTGNPYGHPSAATVARLEEAGARLFRTDLDGSVELSTNGTDLTVLASGGRPRPSYPPAQRPLGGLGFCPIPAPDVGARRRRAYNRADVDPIARGGGAHPARAGRL